MTRRWDVRGLADGSITETASDVASKDSTPLLQRLFTARGFTDEDQIRRFCEPRLTDLHDPTAMCGVEIASARLVDAIKNHQHIVIYGDYDVDGITATAILYHSIKLASPEAKLNTYVPHRLDEGYGLNADALRQLRADGADLVISVDCGVTAHDEAQIAKEIGLDLIITDHHHLPPEKAGLPEAFAIVHPGLPNKSGQPYPFADLCGAGVAFKLAWYFATLWCGSQRVSKAFQDLLIDLLPLVALGTIADVVPLVDENRVLTLFGLRRIKQTPFVGLKALIEASNLMDESIDCEKVGFVLGPRLNACGRMGHAREAMKLLTDATPSEAMEIATQLDKLNRQRQKTQRDIVDQAMGLAEDMGMTGDDHRVIVLAHESWHPGVVGIACSRLAEKFGRPVVLMQKQGDICKGSARSVDGYSIHDGLESCRDLLTTFGGHEMAAGLSLATTNLDAFVARLKEHANANIEVDDLMPSIKIDCDATLDELDYETVKQIGAMSPFGRGNRRPTIRITGAVLAEAPRQMGAQGKHLSMRIRQDNKGQRRMIRTVWWSEGARADHIATGMKLDVAIEPKLNTWNGRTNVEAELRDVRVCEI
ncbi:MAG: single-stranded-DNA-specific exonuclease RecJ [Planctomycetota bacterium]|nr:single-stranded-DNA-specific exonuclease RecJ [Planctomycetota bacterium]